MSEFACVCTWARKCAGHTLSCFAAEYLCAIVVNGWWGAIVCFDDLLHDRGGVCVLAVFGVYVCMYVTWIDLLTTGCAVDKMGESPVDVTIRSVAHLEDLPFPVFQPVSGMTFIVVDSNCLFGCSFSTSFSTRSSLWALRSPRVCHEDLRYTRGSVQQTPRGLHSRHHTMNHATQCDAMHAMVTIMWPQHISLQVLGCTDEHLLVPADRRRCHPCARAVVFDATFALHL